MKSDNKYLKEIAKIYIITNMNSIPDGMKFNSNLNSADYKCLTIAKSQLNTLNNIVGTNKEVNLDYDSPNIILRINQSEFHDSTPIMSKGEVSRSNYDGYEQFIGGMRSITRSNIYKIPLSGELILITNDIPYKVDLNHLKNENYRKEIELKHDVKRLNYFPFIVD